MAERKSAQYLLCYDIRCRRRLTRVHRVAKRWGVPVQYSVFRCELSQPERRRLMAELHDQIDSRVDDVRLYQIEPRSPAVKLGADLLSLDHALFT